MYILALMSAMGGLVACLNYFETRRARQEQTKDHKNVTIIGYDSGAPAVMLPSPIAGVSKEAWTAFMFSQRTQKLSAVSKSNALGCFELKPRRLADLGIIGQTYYLKGPAGNMVWTGDFIAPLTPEIFLKSAKHQYIAFADSMKEYAKKLDGVSLPEGMSLSGALALLHRCGPSGLKNLSDRFPDTQAAFDRANGIF